MDSDARRRIREAAVAFVEDAVSRLDAARALPLIGRESPWLDHIRIWNVLGNHPGKALSDVLEAELPIRFKPLSPMPRAEDYALAFLRAVVATAAVKRIHPVDAWRDVQELVDELLEQVDAPDHTVRSIRLLTHVDVSAIAGSVVHGVRLEPVRDLQDTFSRELKEAVSELERIHVMLGSSEPRALAITEATGARDAWLLAFDVRAKLQYVTTALRLLTGATIAQSLEVYGLPSMIHATGPTTTELDPEPVTHWRRVAVLQPADLEGIRSLVGIFADLDSRPPKRLPSLVVAIGRFNRSHRPASWQDLVVDLSIGIEAAFSTGEREDLTLALRSRAAHLLALSDDPAEEIFRDVGELLGMRGRVVHGSVVPESEWARLFERRGINQIDPFDRFETAMDRWRDLLRRAILARLLLSEVGGGKDAPWPLLGGAFSIDQHLVSPAGRQGWRRMIRKRAHALGVSGAWRRAEPLHDYLHDPWSVDLNN